MKKINLMLIAVLLFTAFTSEFIYSQTTVTFKPNSTVGKDALIFTRVSYNDANTNFGNYPEIAMISWAWGGKFGTTRCLLEFTELASIPTNAVITDVKLVLHGISTSVIAGQGNSYYTGSSFVANPVIIKQITQAWDEGLVTWNNQPQTTIENQMTIPASTAQWNWDYTVDNTTELNTIVQNMVNNPSTNHGFMLQLQTEERYRDMLFASSDNADPTLWPELIVTYESCNADFNFCGNNDGTNFVFNAYKSSSAYNWKINGNIVANTKEFNYNLQSGSNEVCLTSYNGDNTCTQCATIIISGSQNNNISYQSKNEEIINNVTYNKIEPCDIINIKPIEIYPNPTNSNWNVKINSLENEKVEIILRDSMGKIVLSENRNINIGENELLVNGNNLPKGIYLIEIKGEITSYSQKISKY